MIRDRLNRAWSFLKAFGTSRFGIFVLTNLGVLTAALTLTLFANYYGGQFAQVLGTYLALISITVALIATILQTFALKSIAKWVEKVTFNDVTLQIFSEIQRKDTLSRRMRSGEVPIKQQIAQALMNMPVELGNKQETSNAFAQMFLEQNIFVESGSTYAYIALELRKYLDENPRSADSVAKHVFTNNILAYMALIFQRQCRLWLYPGTPSGKYGATFGQSYIPRDDNFFGNSKKPSSINEIELRDFLNGGCIPGRTDDSASHKSAKQTRVSKSVRDSTCVDIIFMAISRLHLARGPHVGSEENASFKRGLLSYAKDQNVPVVIMIDWSKVEEEDAHFDGKRCVAIYPDTENTTQFGDFVSDIDKGNVFLLVGYDGARIPPKVAALEEKIAQINANGDVGVMCREVSGYPISLVAVFAAHESRVTTGTLGVHLQSILALRAGKATKEATSDEA